MWKLEGAGGKYEIDADVYCFTLYQMSVLGDKSNNPGGDKRNIVGYYADIRSLVRKLVYLELISTEDRTNIIKDLRVTEDFLVTKLEVIQKGEPT